MTEETTQIETRQRGVLGTIILWLFIAWNVGMPLLAIVVMANESTEAGNGSTEAGTALVTLWIMGAPVLGLMVLCSRGRKIIITRTTNTASDS